MVRLFLFRLGSLLGLFGLLVWEAFRSQNEDNFAGKLVDNHNKHLSKFFFIYYSDFLDQFIFISVQIILGSLQKLI